MQGNPAKDENKCGQGLPVAHKSSHTVAILFLQPETSTQQLQGRLPVAHYLMAWGDHFYDRDVRHADICQQLNSCAQ